MHTAEDCRATNIRDDGYMPAGSRRQRSGRDWAELEHLLGVLIRALAADCVSHSERPRSTALIGAAQGSLASG